MNVRLLATCTGATLGAAQHFVEPLRLAMGAYAIDTLVRQAMFLANVGVETGGLSATAESLNYSVDALMRTFGRHRISADDALRLGRIPGQRVADQEGIANRIYGGDWGTRNLGNHRAGDGWLYRGRGLFQTTGRHNYRRVRDRMRVRMQHMPVPDFEATPDRLAEPQWAALSAADYWDMRGLAAWADAGDFDAVCDLLNLGQHTARQGDAHGFASRQALYRTALAALERPA